MSKIIAVGLGGKHELEVTPEDTIRSVKAKLEPLTSLSADELKLVVKGKTPTDQTLLSELGLADGAKIMLMRSKEGAKKDKAPAGSASGSGIAGAPPWLVVGANVDYLESAGGRQSQPAVVKAIHTDDPPQLYCTIAFADGGAERQTPLDRLLPRDDRVKAGAGGGGGGGALAEAGEGPISLGVSQGARKFTLRCEASTSVHALKKLLEPLVGGGAAAATMKLLSKGKEAADASTVEELGLAGPSGGKLMLLFKARHHREQEGAALVKDASAQLSDLLSRVQKLRHKLTKRLLDSAEAQVQLGALDEEIGEITLDLKNAAPNESSEAAGVREQRLAQAAEIADELRAARDELKAADLAAQLGR